MRIKIISIFFILVIVLNLYLLTDVFRSSLRYENNKALFNARYFKDDQHGLINLKVPEHDTASFLAAFNKSSPLELELYLRTKLLDRTLGLDEVTKMQGFYQELLQTRPSWPYLYSGLAQVQLLNHTLDESNLEKAMRFGGHERKVIKSMAEILFYNWDTIDYSTKNSLLEYLSDQDEVMIGRVIDVSAKFARIYAYCDFLYEKKHVEYAACKHHYWQPLKDL